MTDPKESPSSDEEFGLQYQIFVLQRMIQQLPKDVQELLLAQLGEVVKELQAIRSDFVENIGDTRHAILDLEFDLYATKNERDALKKRLNEEPPGSQTSP